MFVNFNILNQLGSPAINSNTFANRPAAGQIGRLFVSTDTFEIYRDNGTTWDLIGGPGSSTITGTGTATQIAYFTSSQSIGSSSNLFWDATNNRLGLGTQTPGARLDIHSAADVGLQLNGTGASPSILQEFLSAGVAEYDLGYVWNADVNYQRFRINDVSGAKEVLTIDKQSRYVGINFQYSSLTDQPQYMLDLSGGSFHTNVGQYLVGTPTDLTRSFAASGDANSIALWLEEYGGSGTAPDIFMNRGRGSVTSKSNVLVGDGLGGMTFAGFLNNNLLPSISFGATVVNLNTINNIADADFSIQQTYNSTSFNTNFTVFANGGGADIRGSVTAASFIPDSSTIPTNGMYLSSANNLSFATNGTEKVRFTSGGTLRVGTPTFNLGSISTSDSIFVFDNKIQYINIGMSSDNAYINTDWFSGGGGATPNLLLQVGGVTRARINTTGNFLINTSTDNGIKFQVAGDMYSSNELYLDNGKYIRFQRSSGGLYIQTLGILSGTDDVSLVTTGDFYLRNGSAQNLIKTTNAGNSEFLGNIKTGAPTTGTAATWKLGQRVAAAVVLDATQYIEVEVGGTFYKLAIVT